MPQMKRMLYRDSAKAGEKRTNEERGESRRQSCNFFAEFDLSPESVSAERKRYLFRHTVCPGGSPGTRPGVQDHHVCGESLPENETNQTTEKGEETT